MEQPWDVAIVGGGPGGYVAAIRAAQLGGRVVLIEGHQVGGTCLNRGCIPTKALLASAQLLMEMRNSGHMGIVASGVSLDFAQVMAHKERTVTRLRTGVESLLQGNGVSLVRGTATFKAAKALRVRLAEGGEREVAARNIIIATGSLPARPPIAGLDLPGVINSDQALELGTLPSSIVIVGGGAIGVEFACIFSEFGSQVTLVEMLPNLIPTEDVEIARKLEQFLAKRGLSIFTGATVESISAADGQRRAALRTASPPRRASGPKEVTAEVVLVATGRTPNTRALGLAEMGIATEKGAIKVDDRMRTSLDGVYAIGDAVGGIMLAHVASAEGVVAAENALGGDSRMSYKAIPNCIFTIPQVASVGLTEQKAREAGYQVKVGRFPFVANGKALAINQTDGLVKLVVDGQYGELLGLHIIGPEATDLIEEGVLAIGMEATVEAIARTVHPHPTLSEAIVEAAHDAVGSPIHVLRRRTR